MRLNQIRKERRSISPMYYKTFKILLFGDSNVEITKLTPRFLTDTFKSDLKMTMGVDFKEKSVEIEGKKVKLNIWAFGGQERFRFLLPTYVRGADGGIFLYDITSHSSIAHIDDWLLLIRNELSTDKLFPIIMVGYNADLIEAREVKSKEAIEIAKSRKLNGNIECNFKTGENVDKVFMTLTTLMLQNSNSL